MTIRIFLSITEASSATSKPSDEVTASKYGDVNLDGSVNIADVVAINMPGILFRQDFKIF